MAMPALGNVENTLVLYGDTPLLEVADLKALATALEGRPDASLALMTCVLEDPTGYGRVLRDDKGRVVAIREHRDLRNEKERAITEVNPGVYAARVAFLREALAKLTPNNAQNELYLTDVVEAAGKKGGAVAVPDAADESRPASTIAPSSRPQRLPCTGASPNGWARSGVTVRGEPRIDESVEVAPDATLHAGVELRGKTVSRPASPSTSAAFSPTPSSKRAPPSCPIRVITSSRVGPRARIGPFAHLRPESDIGEEAHVGNFVETKKTVMHARSKANHLAYLGDGEIGEATNVGAGTIFCNYDGFNKHKTTLGRGVFIGSRLAARRAGDGRRRRLRRDGYHGDARRAPRRARHRARAAREQAGLRRQAPRQARRTSQGKAVALRLEKRDARPGGGLCAYLRSLLARVRFGIAPSDAIAFGEWRGACASAWFRGTSPRRDWSARGPAFGRRP